MNAKNAAQLAQAPADRSPAKSDDSVIAQLRSLVWSLGTSQFRLRLGLLAAGIVLVICANSVGQIGLNAWQGAFFDALELVLLCELRDARAL
jgi:ABC-type uncharacterized transport system fused permease/ATPase subunit